MSVLVALPNTVFVVFWHETQSLILITGADVVCSRAGCIERSPVNPHIRQASGRTSVCVSTRRLTARGRHVCCCCCCVHLRLVLRANAQDASVQTQPPPDDEGEPLTQLAAELRIRTDECAHLAGALAGSEALAAQQERSCRCDGVCGAARPCSLSLSKAASSHPYPL